MLPEAEHSTHLFRAILGLELRREGVALTRPRQIVISAGSRTIFWRGLDGRLKVDGAHGPVAERLQRDADDDVFGVALVE